MELWIRSQDREMLLKVLDVRIGGSQENIIRANYYSYYNGCEYADLGQYATKKRALEVLDEIQDILKPRTIQKFRNELKYNEDKELKTTYIPFDTFENTEIQELTTYVYEMPKE